MRLFILSLLIFFFLPAVNAQISTNISGLEIGRTELVDGVRLLKSIDKETIYYESNGKIEVAAHNFTFAGIKWSNIIASFENGLLMRVQLNTDDYSSKQSLRVFEKLNDAFLSKYNKFLTYSSPSVYMYKDEYVRVMLSYDESCNSFTTTYTYEYKPQIGEGI